MSAWTSPSHRNTFGAYRNIERLLVDVNLVYPEAAVHLRNDSATVDGTVATTFDVRNSALRSSVPCVLRRAHLQSCCTRGKKRRAPHLVGEVDISSWINWSRSSVGGEMVELHHKGITKEKVHQIIYLGKTHRYKLAVRTD